MESERMEYIKYAHEFYKSAIENPYVSKNPVSSTIDATSVDRTDNGFIFWLPGVPGELCGRRIHVSCRQVIDGPLTFKEWLDMKNFFANRLDAPQYRP